jgi:predicted HTH transcriptional regulator
LNLKELGLNERQIETLRVMVNEKKVMTNSLYRKKFKITDRTALRDLNFLLKKGLIKKEGFKKDAVYKAV